MDNDNLVQQIESVMDFSRNSVLWDINQSTNYQTEQINQTYFTQQSMCQSNLNNWYSQQMQQCCNVFNRIDASMCQKLTKKESLQERLYNSVFPIDPIRDWAEKEIERICKKYSWLDEI